MVLIVPTGILHSVVLWYTRDQERIKHGFENVMLLKHSVPHRRRTCLLVVRTYLRNGDLRNLGLCLFFPVFFAFSRIQMVSTVLVYEVRNGVVSKNPSCHSLERYYDE